jgi:hypothetical protein
VAIQLSPAKHFGTAQAKWKTVPEKCQRFPEAASWRPKIPFNVKPLRRAARPPRPVEADNGDHRCIFISADMGTMLWLRLVMIQSEPNMTKLTINMPNANASTLFVLSGPVVIWRKNTK